MQCTPQKTSNQIIKIISTLLATRKIDSRGQLNHGCTLPGETAEDYLVSVIIKVHEENEDIQLDQEHENNPALNNNLNNIAGDNQNTHNAIIVKETDHAIVKLYQRYVTEDTPLSLDDELSEFIETLHSQKILTETQLLSAQNAIKRIEKDTTTRSYLTKDGVKISLDLQNVLVLVWRALNDQNKASFVQDAGMSLEDQDNRKKYLINNLIQAQNEYGQNSSACWMGTRNLIVNTLNQIHVDVSITTELPLSQEIIIQNYQAFCSKALKQLMNKDINLFYKYVYHCSLKNLPYGAPENSSCDKNTQDWVEQQQNEFRKYISNLNKENTRPVSDEELNKWLNEVIDPSFSGEPVLNSDFFKELTSLETIAWYCQKGAFLHQHLGLESLSAPLFSILDETKPINEKIISIRHTITQKLIPGSLLKELETCPLIALYLKPLKTEEKEECTVACWPFLIDDLLEHKKVNYEASFLVFLKHKFNTICPERTKWLNALPDEDKVRFFKEYLEQHATLSEEQLTNFIPQWALKNNCLSHITFSKPIEFIDQDLRGIDLSSLDLKNVTFENCDLRLTNIVKNKTLNASIFSQNNNNLLETSIIPYAFLTQNHDLKQYLLNRRPVIEQINKSFLTGNTFDLSLIHHIVTSRSITDLSLILVNNPNEGHPGFKDEILDSKFQSDFYEVHRLKSDLDTAMGHLIRRQLENEIQEEEGETHIEAMKAILKCDHSNLSIYNWLKELLWRILETKSDSKVSVLNLRAIHTILKCNHSYEAISLIDKDDGLLNTVPRYAVDNYLHEELGVILKYNHSFETIYGCSSFKDSSSILERALHLSKHPDFINLKRVLSLYKNLKDNAEELLVENLKPLKIIDEAALLLFHENKEHVPEGLKAMLGPLETKINILRFRNEVDATREALKLYNTLYHVGTGFLSSKKTEEDYILFKKDCDKVITEVKPILETHRGWARYFCNLVLLIARRVGANKMTGHTCFFQQRQPNWSIPLKRM